MVENLYENCLICLSDQHSSCHSTETTHSELLQDRFTVLCQYMDWARPLSKSFTFDFQCDPFPFCKECVEEIVRLHDLHENLQKISQQIQHIRGLIVSRMLESFQRENLAVNHNNKEVTMNSEEMTEVNPPENAEPVSEEIQKNVPEQKVSVTTPEDPDGSEGLTDIKTNEVIEKPEKSSSVPKKTVPNDPGAEESIALRTKRFRYYRDLTKKRFDVNNSTGKERKRKSGNDHEAEQMEILLSPHQHLSMNMEVDELLDSPSTSSKGVAVAAPSTSKRPKRSKRSRKLPDIFEQFSPEENKLHLFAKSKYCEKIDQIASNRFSYNRKRFFELVDGNNWKCLECGMESVVKMSFLAHFERQNPCYGQPPANAVKEHQFLNVLYDELSSGGFECRLCPFKTKKHKDIKNHIDECHQEKAKNSPQNRKWKRVGPDQLKFEHHTVLEKKDDSGQNRLQCMACKTITKTKSDMRSHLQKNHGKCNPNRIIRVEPNKFMTTNNITFEFRDDQHYCLECGFVAGPYEAMLRHVRTEHTHKKDMVCDVCGKVFNDVKPFRYHMRKQHGIGQDFACTQCDRVFKIPQDLRYHVNTIHAKKDVLCETCGKAFATQGLLKVHMKNHTQVACEICGKIFNIRTIKMHMDTHSTEHKYECPTCHKKFKHHPNLGAHMRVCGGKKPYSCDICGMCFTQAFSVTKHKNSIHFNPSGTGRRRGRKKDKDQKETATSGSQAESANIDAANLVAEIIDYTNTNPINTILGP